MIKCDVLVTGSSGFIGQYLCEYLIRTGLKVVGIDKRNSEVPFDLICHDLTQPMSEQIEARVCVHLASSVGGILFNNSVKSDMREYNAEINNNVVKICKQSACDRMIFFSSINVFENNPTFSYEPIRTMPTKTAYAESKAKGEQLFAKAFKDFVVIRPTNVFGKRQTRTHDTIGESHVIPDLIKKIKEDDVVQILGDGTQVRNFVHVMDIVEFVEKTILFEGVHYLNLRSNLTITIANLALELSKFLERNVQFEFDPSYMKYESFKIVDFGLDPAVRMGWKFNFHSISSGLEV